MEILFLIFFFGCFFHIFAIGNQLPGFSISRLANVEDFLNVNYFLNVNMNVSINNFLVKHICAACYLILRFYYLTCSVTDFRDFDH